MGGLKEEAFTGSHGSLAFTMCWACRSTPTTERKSSGATTPMKSAGHSSQASQMFQIIGQPITWLVGKHPFQKLFGKILGAQTEGDGHG